MFQSPISGSQTMKGNRGLGAPHNCFQSPISGSQRGEATCNGSPKKSFNPLKRVTNIIIAANKKSDRTFQSPISGSQTHYGYAEESAYQCFNPLISGSQTNLTTHNKASAM